jgi:hypothetical protein
MCLEKEKLEGRRGRRAWWRNKNGQLRFTPEPAIALCLIAVKADARRRLLVPH